MKPIATALALTAAVLAAVLASAQPVTATASDEKKTDKKADSSAAIPAGDYKLGPGDKLRIEVYKDPQLSQSLQVRPDGKITLPLAGDIDAAGVTPIELRDTVTRQLKQYINNPVVTVIVVEATAATAYVVGEVNHPGAVALQGGQMTVLQALAMAGGLKDFADAKNIRILRRSVSGTQSIAFNYRDAIRGGAPVYLRPGDTVVVPD